MQSSISLPFFSKKDLFRNDNNLPSQAMEKANNLCPDERGEENEDVFSSRESFILKRKKEEKYYSLDNDHILNELNLLKEDYYRDNGKNIFFKKKQKIEIAKKICNNFDLFFLFKKTVFRIKNTNIVFIDYKFFKIYMNEAIYEELINYILYVFDDVIKDHNSLVVQVDADTITPSAVERYKSILVRFNERCVHTNYIGYLQKWVIYNVPSFIESILNVFVVIIHPDILHSLERYSKEESGERLRELFKNEEEGEI